jgi:hypothetical protein
LFNTIAFPSLITEIILRQYLDILHPEEETRVRRPAHLTFDYRLFVGTHVPDIVISKVQDSVGISPSLTKANKDEVLAE